MKNCKHCGKELRDEDVFCPYCGQEQNPTNICPNCQRPVKDYESFCSYCGTQVKHNRYTYTYDHQPKEEEPVIDPSYLEEKEPVANPLLNMKMWIVFIVMVVLTVGASIFYGDGITKYLMEDPEVSTKPGTSYNDSFSGTLKTEFGSTTYYGNINNGGYVFADEKALYALNNDMALIKRYHQTNEEVVISDNVSGYIQVYNGTLYYTDEKNHYLYRVDENNKSQVVIEDALYYVIFYKDKIYYQKDSDGESIYCALLDGSQETKLNDDHSYNIVVYNEQIYYTTATNGIYRMNLDGTKQTQLSNEHAYNLSIVNDVVFFINAEDNHLYSMSLNGQNRKAISNFEIAEFVIDQDIIYFSDSKFEIGRMRLNGEDKESLDCVGLHVQVVGDYVFYQEVNTFFGTYGDWQCCLKDGTEQQSPFKSSNYQYV